MCSKRRVPFASYLIRVKEFPSRAPSCPVLAGPAPSLFVEIWLSLFSIYPSFPRVRLALLKLGSLLMKIYQIMKNCAGTMCSKCCSAAGNFAGSNLPSFAYRAIRFSGINN